MKGIKIRLCCVVMIMVVFISVGCNKSKGVDSEKDGKNTSNVSGTNKQMVTDSSENKEAATKKAESTIVPTATPKRTSLIDPNGTTLETRILVPDGYTRVEAPKGSFTEFIRKYEMKPDKSKVLLYDGSEKDYQGVHVAVFKLPIEKYDLQQCADSIMRMYAEYYWHTKQYNKISFHFVSGFNATYSKWIQGYNIKVGSSVTWVRDSSCNSSYESFKKYMRIVFNYASTLSMDKESTQINIKDIQVGDIFIKGGSPGHVVMIVDVAVNEQGKKAFLLAQGYMPAQEFHVLKNAKYVGIGAKEDSLGNTMWYFEEDVTYPFNTPEYIFEQGSLKRPKY